VADRGCGAGVEPGHRRQTGSSAGVAHAYVGLGGGTHVGIGVGPGWSGGAGSSDGRWRPGDRAGGRWAAGRGGAAHVGDRVAGQAGARRQDGEEQPAPLSG
jgi:hypothetical protein